MNKIFAAALLVACASLAQAETSPAKKELVAKVLELQRPVIEGQVRSLAQQPAGLMMQQIGAIVQQRVPLEKREPLLKDIQNDLRKYVEDAAPVLRSHAVRLLPQTSGAVLESKFSEAELKQLVSTLESPVFRKYQQSNEEMFRPLVERLAPDARAELEPRLKALDQTIRKKLEAAMAPPAGAPAPGPAPAAPAPAAPAKP